MLWQPLDQCPIAAQAINLTGEIFSRNTSCVFTRELNREPQRYLPIIYISIHSPCYDYASSYPNVHALFSCPLLIYHVFSSRPTCCIHVS